MDKSAITGTRVVKAIKSRLGTYSTAHGNRAMYEMPSAVKDISAGLQALPKISPGEMPRPKVSDLSAASLFGDAARSFARDAVKGTQKAFPKRIAYEKKGGAMEKESVSGQKIHSAMLKRWERDPRSKIYPRSREGVAGWDTGQAYPHTIEVAVRGSGGAEHSGIFPFKNIPTARTLDIEERLGVAFSGKVPKVTRSSEDRETAKRLIRATQKEYPKLNDPARRLDPEKLSSYKETSMNPFFDGFSSELKKLSAQIPSPAAVETLSAKLMGVIKRRPVLAAATVAAAGAGAGVGAAQAKAKHEAEDKRREEIRQLLMTRLSEGGYITQ